ncbi:MAG TPA: glycosyltransferase 87 family protein, partial [Ignavibacteriaceae bacterium]|nr:glycosyltransferase 87 family protein [Ignavibacteriaceae bacterium]
MSNILSNWKLYGIIVLSLIVRFYISFGTGLPWITIDSVNYIHQAEALLKGDYQYYFPNGYPLIIAISIVISSLSFFKVFLILLNIFLSTLGIVLIYRVSEKYFENEKYALIASALAALYPNQLRYVHLILTEVPSTFFVVLSLYFLINKRENLSGFSIGFASAIKTTLVGVPLIFSAYLFFKKKFREGVLFLVFSLIPILIFLLYGYLKKSSFTLYIDLPKVFYISLGLENVPADFFEGIKLYAGYLIDHPLDFFYERLKSLWDLWGFLLGRNEGLRNNLFFVILSALRFPLIVFAVYGFMKAVKNEFTLYLLIPALTITFIHALIITSAHEPFIANPRYIFPSEPFLIILAVYGLKSIRRG